MEDFIGKYNGNQIDSRLDKVKDMVGATASEAGAAGLVPAPAAGKQTSFLCGDGTWKDVRVKDEAKDIFLNTLADLLTDVDMNGPLILTQSQYNNFMGLFVDSVDLVSKYIQPNDYFLKASPFPVNCVICTFDPSGNTINIIVEGSMVCVGSGFVGFFITINDDLSFSIAQSIMNVRGNGHGGIQLSSSSIESPNGNHSNIDITLKAGGDGSQALMDNGEYKDIRGVDITSYIFEPDSVTLVSSMTKSTYDKIKGYILNNDHMYIAYSMSDSGIEAAFNSDITASYIYDAAYLIFFDSNAQKMSKIKIDYNTYEVSAIVI